MENITIDFILGLIAIGQFVTGGFFWYCGIQVRMLRLELVSKRECEAYRDRLREELNSVHTCVSSCKVSLDNLTRTYTPN